MKSLRGFTLIELLVVIAILGVLAVGLIVLINPLGRMQKTRNQIRKTTLRDVSNAIERYRISHGVYPASSGWCGASGSNWYVCPDPDDWIPGLVASGEIKELPTDPRSGQVNSSSDFIACRGDGASNYYLYYSNGTDYKLLAHCTPEGTLSSSDPFYDSGRPSPMYSWAVWSSDVSKGW